MNQKTYKSPPKLVEWLHKGLFPDRGESSTVGDLREEYANVLSESGTFRAWIWCWIQIAKSIPGFLKNKCHWSSVMLGNYLKIAFRNIKKHKKYSFINIVGLAVGIACCILILLWVDDEISYDRFHSNSENIFRVITEKRTAEDAAYSAVPPNPLGPALKADYPEVANFARFSGGWVQWLVKYEDKVFLNDKLGTADPSFFEIFSFHFLKGNPATALQDKSSIVITESMAKKYFGNEDPMGKIIQVIEMKLKVTGILEDIPQNSHMQFDYVFPIENMERWWSADLSSWKQDWKFSVYIQLQKDVNVEDFNQKISGIVNSYDSDSNIKRIYLQPLKDVHLRSDLDEDYSNMAKGSITHVYIFSTIALCILIIACINFVNLSTALSGFRAKEIGIRKVVGAQRKDLIKQFIVESLVFSFIALLLGITLSYIFLPTLNKLSGKAIATEHILNDRTILGFIIITILAGLISGSYAAVFLSSFCPITVLKGVFTIKNKSQSTLIKSLVVFQFAMTIILIIGTTLIHDQLRFIRNRDLGFNKDYLIYFGVLGEFGRNFETVKNELQRHPGIQSITRSSPPRFAVISTTNVNWEGKTAEQNVTLYPFGVDYDYVKTFNMKMFEGRFFSPEFSSDISNFVLNETAVKDMGLKNPVGKKFWYREDEGIIIGVIKDFHLGSLHEKIPPVVLRFNNSGMYISIKLRPENVSETLRFLENKWKEFVHPTYADYPFNYNFLDATLENFYISEQKAGSIAKYFTVLAIFVACLGLFGLASFTAERRTKEIGIRKVLGASASEIFILLSREFTKWVLLANIIAWPVANYFMNKWLQNFFYRIDLSVWIFILSGLAVLVIALLTVSYQSIKVATTNPVDSLRYE